MSSVLVVAPHPDDETLGCGGTLLRHIDRGDDVHWLVVTDMSLSHGFSPEAVNRRQSEIARVSQAYGFTTVHNLGLPPVRLDTIPMAELVEAVSRVVNDCVPAFMYLPFRGDVHTDHATVFDASVSCTKWFRHPSVTRVLCYETLSETDFGLNPDVRFIPNSFVDIGPYLERKIEIAQIYQSEMGPSPFPRSAEALRALARLRGVACGRDAAESFMLLREIVQ